MNRQALAFGVAIEQPPASLPVEVQEYLNRTITQLSGQLASMSLDIKSLQERIAVLEGP